MTRENFYLLALGVFSPILTFIGVYLAYCDRGYFAIGGEFFIPAICVGIYCGIAGK